MAKEDRLDWFPCEPERLLGALAGMRAPKQLVYLVTLLRIYECGGACADTIEALSLRTRLNKRIVTDALSELFKEHRLYSGEGGIRNWKSDDVIADSFALRERRKQAGANGGKRRAEKSKGNQYHDPSNATAQLQQGSTHLQEHKQDSLFSNENRVPASPSKPVPSKVPKPVVEVEPDDGWPADHVDQFWQAFPPFRREGKRKVGEKLAKIRRDKTIGWEALIGAVRRYAATNPGEFASAPIAWLNGEKWDRVYGNENGGGSANGENRNNRGPKLGFAGIAAKLRSERASDSAFFADAGDQKPDNGHRFAASALGGMDRAGEASPVAASDSRR